MDSGNMPDTQGDNSQPVDVVVTDTEATEATPQAEATEETELYVEGEGDQQEAPNKMDERHTRAAWKEEKRKRKEKTELHKAEKERADRLEKRLEEVTSRVDNISRGDRPDPFEFDSKESYYKADEEWRNHGRGTSTPKAEPAKVNGVQLSDDQEWHLHNSETGLRKQIKDYDDAKGRVNERLGAAFNMPDAVITDELAQIAHTYGVDPAKAFYALDRMPGKVDEIVRYAQNPPQVGRILRDLESKVKVRERKNITTKPDPTIKGGGSVNMLQKEVANAFDKYKEDPTQRNHALLQAARKRVKTAKVS